jgi:multicomponent Na+:H+ antiporter subunit G
MIVIDVISAMFLAAGAFFAVVGGIGIVRLPEFYSRMHSAGITDTLGAGFIIFGLVLQAGFSLIAFKLAVIMFFLTITSPSSCHALARSAMTRNLKPVLDHKSDSGDVR